MIVPRAGLLIVKFWRRKGVIMFTYIPTLNDHFEDHAQRLLQQRTSPLADRILDHWRDNEPKRLETLFLQGALRRTIRIYEQTLLDMQKSLEEMEGVEPALSQSVAWGRLMRIEEDEEEAAEAWGMTLEEYRNRSFDHD